MKAALPSRLVLVPLSFAYFSTASFRLTLKAVLQTKDDSAWMAVVL
jgi:hypothetical protein